jgi:hypothetical protein
VLARVSEKVVADEVWATKGALRVVVAPPKLVGLLHAKPDIVPILVVIADVIDWLQVDEPKLSNDSSFEVLGC